MDNDNLLLSSILSFFKMIINILVYVYELEPFSRLSGIPRFIVWLIGIALVLVIVYIGSDTDEPDVEPDVDSDVADVNSDVNSDVADVADVNSDVADVNSDVADVNSDPEPTAVDCVVGSIFTNSDCDAECGPGNLTRTRSGDVVALHGGVACPDITERLPCELVPCPANCTTHVCPTGYTQKPSPESLNCASQTCDTDTCCNEWSCNINHDSRNLYTISGFEDQTTIQYSGIDDANVSCKTDVAERVNGAEPTILPCPTNNSDITLSGCQIVETQDATDQNILPSCSSVEHRDQVPNIAGDPSYNDTELPACRDYCSRNPLCKGFSIRSIPSGHTCYLCTGTDEVNLNNNSHYTYYARCE